MRCSGFLALRLVTFVTAGSILCSAVPARADERILLFVDRDDDDADGNPDGEQQLVPSSAELTRVAVPAKFGPNATFALRGGDVRLLVDGKPIAASAPLSPRARRVELQATRAGRAEVTVFGKTLKLGAIEVRAIDGQGREVDLARSHASLQRTPPDRLGADPLATSADPDALRFVLIGVADDLPGTINLISLSPAGEGLDALTDIPLVQVPCPADIPSELTCGSTLPIRAVADDIDRNHPLVLARSIKAELGGALAVASERGDKLQMIRVAGPRRSPIGAIERFRARLRVILVRLSPRGPPPVGGDDAGALAVARAEVGRANALWGACGVSFGPPAELDVVVVDPPRPHLLALGCDHGLPASGGVVRVRVDGRDIKVALTAGMTPRAAARAVATSLRAAGFTVRVSDNPPIGAGAFGSADVLVRRRDGALASIEAPGSGPISTDPTLRACVGRVDLEDGLQHFGDIDAIAGTVEERALIKAFDDGDPSSIEVFVVPSFAGGGRIGESFISADGGGIRNVLIEDRAGIRADRASFALAHELGHVLLDDPGHPDDFGADTPTRLMDADAANASAYGPRRLLLDECARALRQSGPSAPVSLLRPWPLAPLGGGSPSPVPTLTPKPAR
jgi:hypothetical protein